MPVSVNQLEKRKPVDEPTKPIYRPGEPIHMPSPPSLAGACILVGPCAPLDPASHPWGSGHTPLGRAACRRPPPHPPRSVIQARGSCLDLPRSTIKACGSCLDPPESASICRRVARSPPLEGEGHCEDERRTLLDREIARRGRSRGGRGRLQGEGGPRGRGREEGVLLGLSLKERES